MTFAQFALVAANSTGYSDMELSPDTRYYYRLRATNSGGDSSYSSSADARTLPNPPEAPSGLAATVELATAIRLTWTGNSSRESEYVVERKIGTGAYEVRTTLAANSGSFLDNTVSPGKSYSYRVFARNAGGPSAPTDPVEVTIPAGGRLKVSPVKLSLGTVRRGRTARKTVTVTNSGTNTLTGSADSLEAPFRVLSGGGPFSLAPRVPDLHDGIRPDRSRDVHGLAARHQHRPGPAAGNGEHHGQREIASLRLKAGGQRS